MYGGSARLALPEPPAEAVRNAVLQRQIAETSGEAGVTVVPKPKTVHVHHPTTLNKLRKDPGASVWKFVPGSVALQNLVEPTADGSPGGDTRRVILTSARVVNQGNSLSDAEISYNIPMFKEMMVTNVGTQTGSIHAAGIRNRKLELISKADTEVEINNLELMTLTEEQIEKCFFEASSPDGEKWFAVHKNTPAAKAVVLKENCEEMTMVLKKDYAASHGGSLDGFQQPLLYCNHEKFPIITMSNDYYNFALAAAKEYAKKQQDLSSKIFSNLDMMTVEFSPSGTTWNALYESMTDGMDAKMKDRIGNRQFYVGFDLEISFSTIEATKAAAAAASVPNTTTTA